MPEVLPEEQVSKPKPILWSRYIVIVLVLVFAVALSTWALVMFDLREVQRPNPTPQGNRTFLIGTSGFAPRNYPNQAPDDVLSFWDDVEDSGEIYMVAVDWQDIEVLELAAKFQPNAIVLVLGFQTPEEWVDSIDELISKVSDLLVLYPQITHVAIGNEVNLLQEEYPEDFDSFIEAFSQIHDQLKQGHPDVLLSTTFQYETLIGEGYLYGDSEERESNISLVSEFEPMVDFIGLTLYPHLDFTDPNELPANYLEPLVEITDKPIGVTETGWMSRQTYGGGGELEELNELGFTGSEQEQVDYLQKLVDIAFQDEISFLCWAFIHDISSWTEGDEPSKLPLFDSIGLKYNDGAQKPVWKAWLELVEGVTQNSQPDYLL